MMTLHDAMYRRLAFGFSPSFFVLEILRRRRANPARPSAGQSWPYSRKPGERVMQQFQNSKTREVFETRFAKSIPEHVSIKAHEIMRILVAARGLQDVGVLGPIVRWHNVPERLG